MYLLNPAYIPEGFRDNVFTFHYVSIKSAVLSLPLFATGIFTFHYVSIKSVDKKLFAVMLIHLHSTMYLLNHNPMIKIFHLL